MAVIKILSWKHKGWKVLLQYISREDHSTLHGQEPFTLFHNSPPTIDGAINAFRENDGYRKKIHKGTVLSHHILSLHPDSKKHITMDKLFDIATYYTSHFEDSIVVARPHVSKENAHIHFVMSHNKVRSEKTCRLSKQELAEFKINTQEWILDRYPELEASRVNHGLSNQKDIHQEPKRGQQQKELQMIQRLGNNERTDKHIVKNLVQSCFYTSDTMTEFTEQLQSNNLLIYTYRGKLRGVRYNDRKWTFTRSCGITHEELLQLQVRGREIEKREGELRKIIHSQKMDKSLRPPMGLHM